MYTHFDLNNQIVNVSGLDLSQIYFDSEKVLT